MTNKIVRLRRGNRVKKARIGSLTPLLRPLQTCVLYMVSIASLAPTLGASIYNPAFEQLRVELGASNTEIALSLSLFILFQGGWPVFWSSVAEVTGRKVSWFSRSEDGGVDMDMVWV